MANIVILEDTIGIGQLLKLFFKNTAHTTTVYTMPSEAIEEGAIEKADIIISDFEMISETALNLLQYLSENSLTIPVLINSGRIGVNNEIDAAGYGNLVAEYLNKTGSKDEFIAAVERNI